MAPSVQGESSSNSSNSNSIPAQKFQVFLTFAEDTGRGFTDHLYAALRRRGIKAFKHDETLEKGEEITPQCLGAITDSLIAIVVLSKTYASSTWCLDELHEVLESRKKWGQEVFPIFYGVHPSNVRHQTEGFPLAIHEKRFKQEKVQRWRQALIEVANLYGWYSKHWKNEAVLIEDIVEFIWIKLLSSLHSNNLVGIDSKMVKMESYLGTGLNDVRFIGLWGMGGIGKTTLARAVYKKISNKFEVCHFLENVREAFEKDGLVNLQRKLLSDLKIRNIVIQDLYEGKQTIRNVLSNKKIILVFDDVNNISQLDYLIGYPDWFAAGSRIIITTRDMRLLKSYGVHKIYEIKAMSKDESLQLFSRNAFNKDHPEEDYLNLSLSMVQYAGGLPLALQILGSSLFTKSISQWKDALFKWRAIPSEIIVETFKISYDELEEEEDKAIFLDIACFFRGWRKDIITQVLANYGLHPTIESRLGLLVEKSLIIEERNCLEMHNLLQELGRNIVLQKFPNSFCRLNRLWSPNDIDEVLKRNIGHEGLHKLKYYGVHGLYEIEIQIEEQSLQTSAPWRIVGFVSSVVGVVSYSLSSSFNLLFGEWKLWKIFVYCTMSFIVCGIMLFPRICQGLRSSWVKPYLTYVVLMVTTLYSFHYDKRMTKKPDVLTLISSGAFSLVSLSLSKQTELGFELGVSIFWLAFLMLQLMKIKLILVLVAAVVCYFFILVHSSSIPKPQARTTGGARAINENPKAKTTRVEEHKVDLGDSENEVERRVVQ